MTHVFKTMPSPVGTLTLVASGKGLVAVLWPRDDPRRVRLPVLTRDDRHPVLRQAEKELAEYFAGKRKRFTVAMDFAGTDFQKKVWRALLEIPFGQTRTYGDIARRIGKPKAARAAGAAIGRNPVSLIAPCHRVVGTNGALTGFAGGLAAKKALLALEAGD